MEEGNEIKTENKLLKEEGSEIIEFTLPPFESREEEQSTAES